VADVQESWAPYGRAAAWILREKAKGEDSEWAPYLSILPEHVPSTMFISHDALKLFEDQRLFSYVSSRAIQPCPFVAHLGCASLHSLNPIEQSGQWA